MTKRSELTPSIWSWLQDTYWCVLPENLPALQFDPGTNTLAWVIDQTVWHINGYRNGYFWGGSATLIRQAGEQTPQRGPGSAPVCFTMLGTITPEGRIHLTFMPCKAASFLPATIGIGRAVEHGGSWKLEMQMSSGEDVRTAHWAYMARVAPGDTNWDSLPGVGISVPEMLEGCEPPQPPSEAQ